MRFDSNNKTIDNRGNTAVLTFDSKGIERKNKRKKIKELKKIKEGFYQKNGLLKDRQNGSWTLIQVRPKPAPAIAITSNKKNNTESIHGDCLIHSEQCSGAHSFLITPVGIADVNRVRCSVALNQINRSPLLLSVFFGERR